MSNFPGKKHVVAPPSDPRPQNPIPSPGAPERSAGASPLDVDVLRSALERTLNNFRASLAGKPIRDATETIAEAEAALADEADR